MFTHSKDEALRLPVDQKTIPLEERTLELSINHQGFPSAFEAPCRLTPWFSKKNQPRIITQVTNEDEYKRIIETMPHACEALDGGTVKAYLDIDYKAPSIHFLSSTGRDGQTYFIEKDGYSPLKLIKDEIKRIPLFHEQKYYAMTRKNRRIKGDKIKVSWRIVFPKVIMANQQVLGTYLKAIGYKTNEPFDLSVYNKGRIMNAINCVKPDKEGDDPCPPLDPLMGWGGRLEDRLITAVNPRLPIVNIKDWMPKKEVQPLPKKLDLDIEATPDDKSDVVKLLSMISPDCGYDRWFRVLCCIANCLGKESDGVYDLADEWSTKGLSYDPRGFGKTWSSIKDEGTIGVGTLHMFAKEENPWLYAEVFPKGCKEKKVDIYKSRNYAHIKAAFEDTVFKVIKPVMFYQKKEEGYIVTTEDKIKSTYRNVIYEAKIDGKPPAQKSFVNRWLRDPDMKAYDHAEFDPSRTVGKDVFNTFTGFVAEQIPEMERKDVAEWVRPVYEHLDMLTKGEGTIFIRWWLKNIIRNPKRRAEIAIVLHSSEEGTGKSMVFKMFGEKVIGDDLYKSVQNAQRDLFNKHSNGVQNKLLVQVEEAKAVDIHKNMDSLKDYITNNKQSIERKGVDIYDMKCYTNFVFTTNNDNPIKISATDRRFVVFDCNDARRGDEDYFTNLVNHMNDPKWARAMYQDAFYGDDIPCNPCAFSKARPITSYYKEIQRINIPNWAKYVAVKSIDGEKECHANDFYRTYTYWADASGYGQTKLTQTGFALKIKKLDGIEIKRSNGIKYKFDWMKVVAYLKSTNQWDDEAF